MNERVILKIKDWKRKDGILTLETENYTVRSYLENVVNFCIKNKSGFVQCEFKSPSKKRTTGEKSQNSHIWGHIQQIAMETGNEVQDIEDAIKFRAMKRGYPFHENKITNKIVPNSMTTINTVEASYLIDELHQLASELEIVLIEE